MLPRFMVDRGGASRLFGVAESRLAPALEDGQVAGGLGPVLGFGIGAGVLYISGILVAIVPVKDYYPTVYADVFQERAPEL